jgi:hypothetical protein
MGASNVRESLRKVRLEMSQADQHRVRRVTMGVIVGMLTTFVLAFLAFGFRVSEALHAVLWIMPLNLYFAYTYLKRKPESLKKKPESP